MSNRRLIHVGEGGVHGPLILVRLTHFMLCRWPGLDWPNRQLEVGHLQGVMVERMQGLKEIH
jgi:hypothetical protein